MLTPTNSPEDFHDDDCDCFDCEEQAECDAYDLMECQIKESITI